MALARLLLSVLINSFNQSAKYLTIIVCLQACGYVNCLKVFLIFIAGF